jgi:hypothetical protein
MSGKRKCVNLALTLMLASAPAHLRGQSATGDSVEQQMQRLEDALTRTEAELAVTQKEMQSLHTEIDELQRQLGLRGANAPAGTAATESSSAAEDEAIARRLSEVEEKQAVQAAQIATHDQSKVESASKYPVRLTGLILMSSFVNTRAVDNPATPSIAVNGTGSTGITLRQTVLGLDADGPRLFGARSSGDVRTDFAGTSSSSGYSGGINLLRFRTAHANLAWERATAFFSLDRPIVNPHTPYSLTAVAVPPLAWSGNLWSWNPQVGVMSDLPLAGAYRLHLQGALIDPSDPRESTNAAAQNTLALPNAAERSRWPGLEARVAAARGTPNEGLEIGLGGYFSPHRLANGLSGNSWAGTVDYHIALPARLHWTGNIYRGQGLGGLGGGTFKDYVFRVEGNEYYLQWLDDVGGWTQLKQKLSERLEWNAAMGIDNSFSGQLRPYVTPNSSPYTALARNRTITANVIFSPSAYLLFSLEYRNIRSTPVSSPAAVTNVIGAAAGYRF